MNMYWPNTPGNRTQQADTPRPDAAVARRRALIVLVGGGVVAVLLVVGLVWLVLGLGGAPAPDPITVPAPQVAEPGWDTTGQYELATRPMPAFPESASAPHPLAAETAGSTIALPQPGTTEGRYVPTGFPATVEGAIAQQAALLTAGLAGGDPATYTAAYDSLIAPGTPPASSSRMVEQLQTFRARAGLPRSGAEPGLQITYTPTSALVKGTTDGGRYTVVCVLGEMTVQRNGQLTSGGIGDCQALRYFAPSPAEAPDWHIAPGPAAAPSPDLWPGTAEALAAGFRPLS
ncbi:hypothetical protein [Pseudonocardia sp. WMMC193]|uniref:hypothetical protein n=1 Tax=Pseudonocardia sp. WMMC193 TaxID=2911965 RepID=UPI001F3CF1C4|nr:hypothetical protein [Pseudonocardia sp. WMMC193]MCF7547275.1 hypothetical protein [Pseudonocardia sp. WMMC193]MCF7547370.1 hypothetical protein [Pseudonocardia sp. WMMC193]